MTYCSHFINYDNSNKSYERTQEYNPTINDKQSSNIIQ